MLRTSTLLPFVHDKLNKNKKFREGQLKRREEKLIKMAIALMNFACFLLNHEMYNKKQVKRKITFVNENEIPKQDIKQGEARLIFII